MDEAKAAMDTDDKNVREQRWNAMIEKWHEKYLEDHPDMDQYLEEITYKFQKKIVKDPSPFRLQFFRFRRCRWSRPSCL